MTTDLASGSIFDQRYQILHHLGAGGMGNVFKALELELNRVVALKVLHRSFLDQQDAVQRFKRESQILSRLSHPHILTLYRMGTCGDKFFLVTEFVEGDSLLDLLLRSGPLPPSRVVPIAIQVCRAMEHAHKQGVVHRDLKPSNIMLLADAEQDFVKVLDFGLAKASSPKDEPAQQLTRTGTVIGSVFYMSPEQCQGKQADSRSDVYSLGCVLYELLTGDPPFAGESSVAVMYKHVNDPIPALPTSIAASAERGALEAVLRRCLAKQPHDRFASMSDLARSLDLIMQGRSEEVALPTVPVPWGGRVRLALMPVILLILAAVASLAYRQPEIQDKPVVKSSAKISGRRLPTAENISGNLNLRIQAIEVWLKKYGHDAGPEALTRAYDYLVLAKVGLAQARSQYVQDYLQAQKYLDVLLADPTEYRNLLPHELFVLIENHLRAAGHTVGSVESFALIRKVHSSVGTYLDVNDRAMLCRRMAGFYNASGDLRSEEYWRELASENCDPIDLALYSHCLYKQNKAESKKVLDEAMSRVYNSVSGNSVHRVVEELELQGRFLDALDLCDLCSDDFNRSLYLSGQASKAKAPATFSTHLGCPDYWRHHVLVWHALEKSGKSSEATSYLNRAVESMPSKARWLALSAIASEYDTDKMPPAIERFLEMQSSAEPPTFVPTLLSMVTAANLLVDKHPKLAVLFARKCVAAESACEDKSWLPLHGPAIVHILVCGGENHDALRLCNRLLMCLNLVPPNTRAEVAVTLSGLRGVALENLGDAAEADKAFKHGMELARECHLSLAEATLYTGYGGALFHRRKFDDGIKAYNQALKITDQDGFPVGPKLGIYASFVERARAAGLEKLASKIEADSKSIKGQADNDHTVNMLRALEERL